MCIGTQGFIWGGPCVWLVSGHRCDRLVTRWLGLLQRHHQTRHALNHQDSFGVVLVYVWSADTDVTDL